MTTATSTYFAPYGAPAAAPLRRPARPATPGVQAVHAQYPWMTVAILGKMSARSLRLMRSGD